AGNGLPTEGGVFFSLADRDKSVGAEVAARFVELGFDVFATVGTAQHLRDHGVHVTEEVAKVGESTGIDAVTLIESGRVHLVVNTPRGRGPRADGRHIRTTANVRNVPCLTTVAAARAAALGIAALKDGPLTVTPLQDHHAVDQQRFDV
ncbi:MAG: carbamoyl phosphate synthase large subunit, partial [Acidimicrobiales bacterium]|nr:carbamoyl phosphate synthase large subunit [Acidimicrobiales bacterium]